MQPNVLIYTIMTFLHNLFTAFWIGGMLTLGLSVFPSIRKSLEKGPQMVKLIDTIQKRLSALVYVSILGLFITGAVKAKMVPDFLGLLHFGNKYSLILGIKHILYGIMIIISVLRSRIGWKKENSPNPKTLKIKAIMLIINMILGVAVLFLSALNAAVVL